MCFVRCFSEGVDTGNYLTHWGQVTHVCVDNITIIGLSPGQRLAIIWTNVGILLIEPLGTNFSEILIEIITFSVKKMHLKMSLGNWQPFCLGLNELTLVPKVLVFTHCPLIDLAVISYVYKQNFDIDILSIHVNITLDWIPEDLVDD